MSLLGFTKDPQELYHGIYKKESWKFMDHKHYKHKLYNNDQCAKTWNKRTYSKINLIIIVNYHS